MPLKIISQNINGIQARINEIRALLHRKYHLVLLQELKTEITLKLLERLFKDELSE